MRSSLRNTALAILLALGIGSAHAVLERVGPTDNAPSVGGFPAWYQDTTGLALEFCDPKNQAEVDGGWCLLLPGDVTVPEVFPTNFFDEHFYFDSVATLTPANGGRALLVLAVEAAFAVGPAVPGDQITFARIRVRLDPVPVSGTYRFIHPYGEEAIDAAAGDRIFFTEDIGIGAPGDFSGALSSRLGPFLAASATPGGAEMPALTATNPTPDTDPAHFGGAFAPTAYPGTGKSYLADPARIGPVTGSPLPAFIDSTGASRDHNIFRIEGPTDSNLGVDPQTGASVDWIETTDFSLMGRVFTDVLPGRVAVNRASYTRNATLQKVDVFATAAETTQGRLPAQPRPAPVVPQLSFFDAPCGGVVDPVTGAISAPFTAPTVAATETQMVAEGSDFWAQTLPAAIPVEVCVKDGAARDANGNVVPVYVPKVVTDEVTITEALFDPAAQTLSVAATSSDTVLPPTLTVAFGTRLVDLVNGVATVSPLRAPPAKVRVLSSALGSNEYQVGTGTGTPAGVPTALNDTFTFPEDSAAQTLAVLANDTGVAGGTVSLASTPRLGVAVLNADGTVTYTPNANAFGTDGFTYTVTVAGQVSNSASVTLNITPVNDAPTAVNDSAAAIANTPIQINVIGNDADPDGNADIVAAVNVTQPAQAGATTSVVGGVVTFNATVAGAYTFTYQAQDAAGASSANTATVTVQVAAAETIAIARAEFRTGGGRLRVDGTIAPAANQTMSISFVNSGGTLIGPAGTAIADATGAWALDVRGVALPTGATAVRVVSSNGTVQVQSLTIK